MALLYLWASSCFANLMSRLTRYLFFISRDFACSCVPRGYPAANNKLKVYRENIMEIAVWNHVSPVFHPAGGKFALSPSPDPAQSHRFYRSLSEGSIRYFHNGIYVSARQRVRLPGRDVQDLIAIYHTGATPVRAMAGVAYELRRVSGLRMHLTVRCITWLRSVKCTPHRNCDCVSGR